MGQRGEHNEVPFQLKLLVTVWWLDNQETFRQIADRFSTTRGINNFMVAYCSNSNEHRCIEHFKLGNAHHIVRSTLIVLGESATEYIKWPTADELDEIAARDDFPNTIGTISVEMVQINQVSCTFKPHYRDD
jgi:hypothetical protein